MTEPPENPPGAKDALLKLEEVSRWIASFEPKYPELFEAFRAQGWRPRKSSPSASGYAREAERFAYSSHALQIELEFGGMSFRPAGAKGDGCVFTFGAGETFDALKQSFFDYDQDVLDLLPGDPFPVGEIGGGVRMVMFVSDTGKAAMVTDILNACWLADDPFTLLDFLLFDRDDNPGFRDFVVAQGDRVAELFKS